MRSLGQRVRRMGPHLSPIERPPKLTVAMRPCLCGSDGTRGRQVTISPIGNGRALGFAAQCQTAVRAAAMRALPPQAVRPCLLLRRVNTLNCTMCLLPGIPTLSTVPIGAFQRHCSNRPPPNPSHDPSLTCSPAPCPRNCPFRPTRSPNSRACPLRLTPLGAQVPPAPTHLHPTAARALLCTRPLHPTPSRTHPPAPHHRQVDVVHPGVLHHAVGNAWGQGRTGACRGEVGAVSLRRVRECENLK